MCATSNSDENKSGAREISIYRSPRVQEMYLFVASERELELAELLPDGLLERFGDPVFSFDLELWPQRVLMQADAPTVLAAIAKQGFYLQMPPAPTSTDA